MLTIKKEWRKALAKPLSVGHDSYLSPTAKIVITYKTTKK